MATYSRSLGDQSIDQEDVFIDLRASRVFFDRVDGEKAINRSRRSDTDKVSPYRVCPALKVTVNSTE